MAVRKLNLPKQDEQGVSMYSYSQHAKWFDNRKEYIKQYFFKDTFEGNSYTEFGTKVGEALENNDFSMFSKKEGDTLSSVTRLDEFERPIKLSFPELNFYIRGYIDTNDKALTTLIDYKTGDVSKISKYEDEEYDQLAIYAAAIEQEMGVLPSKAYVQLIEREGNPWKAEVLSVGNKVHNIPQDITLKNIKSVKAKIVKGAREVSSFYKVFTKLNSVFV